MNALEDLIAFGGVTLGAWFIVFLRIGAIVALLPAFGEQSVPMRIKLVVAGAFTFISAPAIVPRVAILLEDRNNWMFVFAGEIIAGLALGLGVRLLALALQTAGAIAAQSTTLSQILGGASVEPLPAMGHVLIIGGMALAVTLGLHIRAAEFMIISYDLLPVGQIADASFLSEWGVYQVSRAFSLAFTLAAPFVIVSMLYNLTLGVINRAMPQLMVAFVGAPVITGGALLLLFLSSPVLLSVWVNELNGFLSNPLRR